MKQKRFKQIILCLLTLLLALPLAGCAQQDSGESVAEVEEPLYVISVNGTEIRVGETKVQALFDAGYEIAWSEMKPSTPPQIQEHTLDPEMQLKSNSYYSGVHVTVGDHITVLLSFVTEEAVPLQDAVIARMEFSFSRGDNDSELTDIMFNGVSVPELTREKAGEMFPDFRGDSAMWFSSGLKNYEYSMGFNSNTGEMIKFSAKREYDVDWTGSFEQP